MRAQSLFRLALMAFTGLFIVFLYSPLAVLAVLSFQSGPEGGPQFPIIEWSTYWYRHLFGLVPPSRVAPLPIADALIRSLVLAGATTVTSTVLGVLSAQAFRQRFRGSGFVFYLIVLGMIVPGVLIGLGIALVANAIGVPRAWWSTSFVAHVLYTFPFAFLVMLAVFNRFDRSVEEAAWSLGVSPARTFRKVTFPLIFPGVLSAMLFSFTLSYDEFSRSLYTSGTFNTLPLEIYGMTTNVTTPVLYALGTLTTAFSFIIILVSLVTITVLGRRARRVAPA